MDKIIEYFAELETTKEYKGYFCSVSEAIIIVILGSFCELRNVSQIQQWASNQRVSEFLEQQVKCISMRNRCILSYYSQFKGRTKNSMSLAVR